MLFARQPIQRFSSALMLFLLVLFYGVKLLHTHPDFFLSDQKLYNKTTLKAQQPNGSVHRIYQCVICLYQVQQDTDTHFYPAFSLLATGSELQSAPLSVVEISSFFPAPENRGPPAIS